MNTKTDNSSAQASWFVGASYGVLTRTEKYPDFEESAR